jgi:hypothetical protein
MLSNNSHEIVGKSLALLGFPVRDRVTGATGVVTSVGFDLYGCVQCIVNPGLSNDGKMLDSLWFDINRLEVTDDRPRMRNQFISSAAPVVQGQTVGALHALEQFVERVVGRPEPVEHAHGPADRPTSGPRE